MKKIHHIAYWTSTGLFSVMILMGVVMYFVQNPTMREAFTELGYPTHIIYPLGIAKALGIVAIISKKSQLLKEWAYAGFFFVLVLGAGAHINIGDGEYAPAIGALILLLISRYYDSRLFGQK